MDKKFTPLLSTTNIKVGEGEGNGLFHADCIHT
jgi:hypothetical protein